MRPLLIKHHRQALSAEGSWEAAVEVTLGCEVTYVDAAASAWHVPDLSKYDVVLVFIRFSELNTWPDMDWRGFSGLRVLMDHDSFQDYGGWPGSPYVGAWTRSFKRHRFDLLVASGVSAAEHFNALGIDCVVVHKGYTPALFRDECRDRAGMCHYGSPYPARLKALRRLSSSGIAATSISAPYEVLNRELNSFRSALVCNMAASTIGGRIGAVVNRYRPGTLIQLHGAPEPMLKNFEASAAGCAVFMDDCPDLADLGFIDGETAFVYSSLDELVEKVRYWREHPESMARVGAAGAALCRARHTWEHRAHELQAHLNVAMGAS